MFDVSFSELIVIGIVALVVIGPERLPKVARTAGLLLGRLQRYVSDVKSDISREMQLDELKKLQSDMRESARDFERSIAGELQAVEQGVGQAIDSVKTDFQQPDPVLPETPAMDTTASPAPTALRASNSSIPVAKG